MLLEARVDAATVAREEKCENERSGITKRFFDLAMKVIARRANDAERADP